MAPDEAPVQQREDARRTPTAPYRKDGADFAVCEHRVDVGSTLLVGSRQIAEAFADVRAETWHKPHALDGMADTRQRLWA